MTNVTFRAIQEPNKRRDGEDGWEISVNGELVTTVCNDDLDISDNALQPLWERLGIKLEFDFDFE